MFNILSGGYENKVAADYVKNVEHLEDHSVWGDEIVEVNPLEYQNNVKYWIRKTDNKFLTETKDQYRTFVLGMEENELLVDYRDS